MPSDSISRAVLTNMIEQYQRRIEELDRAKAEMEVKLDALNRAYADHIKEDE